MSTEVVITIIKPKTIEQMREYYKRQIADVDMMRDKLRADIHAVSTNATARGQISDMESYLSSSKERLVAFQNQRETWQRALTRINGTIKNKNRQNSGRESI
jgi:hypothetical protein